MTSWRGPRNASLTVTFSRGRIFAARAEDWPVAQRANWKGYLKLSLVSCPVALFPAATLREKVSFHLLNRETGHRLKQQYVDAETGEIVERDERARGYEVRKGEYVQIEDEELAAVAIETSHTMEIEHFVPRAEIDPVYFDSSYYLAPDNDVGTEAFVVIRAAMAKADVVGLARVVLYGRERVVALEARGDGLLATTLRYAYEIRADKDAFADIPHGKPNAELLDLAGHIIATKAGHFEPDQFTDRYQDAVLALIAAKQKGRPAPAPTDAPRASNIVDLADALRRSLAGGASSPKAKEPADRAPKSRASAAPAKRAKAAAGTKRAAKSTARKAS